MFDGTGQRYKDSNYGGVWTNLEDRRAMAIVHARQDLEADFPGHFVLIHEWRGGRSITILSEQPANSTMRLHFEMPTMQIFMNTVGYDCLIFKDAEVVYHGERGYVDYIHLSRVCRLMTVSVPISSRTLRRRPKKTRAKTLSSCSGEFFKSLVTISLTNGLKTPGRQPR
jgi:hypothetical protein